MSSDPRSDAPSAGPRAGPGGEPPDGGARPSRGAEGPAALVRVRGEALLEGLERHLPGARAHADGTASFAFLGAAALGLPRDQAELIREAARLHDIGKVYVPAALLVRPAEQLEPAERRLVLAQFEAAAKLGRGAGLPASVCHWLECGAERFDGGGREGLVGAQIPYAVRIIRVACAYDAMTADPGRGATLGERQDAAERALRAAAGTEVDPRVVEALLATIESGHAERPDPAGGRPD